MNKTLSQKAARARTKSQLQGTKKNKTTEKLQQKKNGFILFLRACSELVVA